MICFYKQKIPKIYDQDLRDKVITYLEAGNSCVSASEIFSLSINTVKNWYKRYKKLGHCKPCKLPGKKARIASDVFKEYVNNNPNKTLKEIGVHFGMTSVGALYYMRKTGMRYKKKSRTIVKPALKSVQNT